MREAPTIPDDHPAYAIADAAIAHFLDLCETAAMSGAKCDVRRWLRDAIAQTVRDEIPPIERHQEMSA